MASKAFVNSKSFGIAREYGKCIKATGRYTVPKIESIYDLIRELLRPYDYDLNPSLVRVLDAGIAKASKGNCL